MKYKNRELGDGEKKGGSDHVINPRVRVHFQGCLRVRQRGSRKPPSLSHKTLPR